uniref:Polyprotein n=1 Tax=Atrato picorna-like virus 1 TaxID=2689354 RepID=A0A6B9KGK2_9VIRU|nr:polyprotein [Atrato picorna-like virus 1]
MKAVMNKINSQLLAKYKLDNNLWPEEALQKAFSWSKQQKQGLEALNKHTLVTLNKHFAVYFRATLIGTTPKECKNQNLPKVVKKLAKQPRLIHLDWTILDDVKFMRQPDHYIHATRSNMMAGQSTMPFWQPGGNPLRSDDYEEDLRPHYTPAIRSIYEIAPAINWATARPIIHREKTDLDEPMEAAIPTLVAEAIGNMDFFKTLKCDTTLLASAIASSVISIGTSVYTLCTTETSTATKVLNSVAIVSSLSTFALAVIKIFNQFNIKHHVDKVFKDLPELATSILSKKFFSNSWMWVYPAITTLISIILAGLTSFNICDIKTIIEKSRLITATKTLTTTSNDIAKFIMEDLAGLDVTGDQKAFEELHIWAKRTSELAVKSVVQFIQDPELNFELHNAVNHTLPIITNKYVSKDISHASRSAYQLILTNLSKLQDKIEGVKIINDACKRIETVGILFAGKKGIGKSRLCTYVAEFIASIMGLPKTIYNLNKSKDTGFYGPYGGAAFAEIQEWMALRENDPNLAHLNQIISGDHFNLESAHLAGKVQPFQGRVVFLTANKLCPDLLRVLDIEAAKATWDRILRFECIDELVEGRSGVNSHRKPNFTHMSFKFVTTTDEVNEANLKSMDITIHELLGICLYQVANRELQFLKSGLETKVLNEDEVRERMSFLRGIVSRNDQPIIEATANSGQDFNILRIDGPQYTGKTRLANQIANYVHGLLPNWPIIHTKGLEDAVLSPKNPSTKGIYIVDDIIECTKASYQMFLRWINQGHPDNLYIISSNHTYKTKKRYNVFHLSTTKYIDFDTLGVSSGIARRLGLEREVQCSDGSTLTVNPRATHVHVSKPGDIQHGDEQLTLGQLKEIVMTKFQSYLKSKEVISVRYETYTQDTTDFDVVVRVPTYSKVKEVFQNFSTLTRARMGLTPGVTVFFKPHLIPEIARHFRSERELLPGNVLDAQSLVEQAEAFCVIMNRIVPGLSARFTVDDTRDNLILQDRVLYVNTPLGHEVLAINHCAEKEEITIRHGQDHFSVTYKDYSKFIQSGITPTSLNELPLDVLSQVNLYVSDNIKDSIFKYQTLMASIEIAKEKYVSNNLSEFIKNKPVLTIIIGLVSLTTAGSIAALITKLFSKQNATSNSSDDENDYDPKISIFARRYKTALLEDAKEAKNIREEVAKAGLSRQFNQWEYEWRSGNEPDISNALPLAMEKGDVAEIIKLSKKCPPVASKVFASNYSNMLTKKDEYHQPPGPLEQLAEKLRKNYVQVHSNIGNLYGLMIKGNLGITLAHCLSNTTKELLISSNGIQYKAIVQRVTRERDLCTFRVVDKTWPAASDITPLFPSSGQMLDLTSGWYVRPTEKPLFVNAPIEYIDRHCATIVDSNNPFFRVEGKSWKYRLTGIATCAQTFKIGDCGFPLIGFANNNYYIIGIHNAFNLAGFGWFASVTKQDISEITANSSPVKVSKSILHPKLNAPMIMDDKMHELATASYKRSIYEGVSPLAMWGYNEQLKFPSHPKHKKIYCDVASKFVKCETIGSALTDKDVTDFSKLYPDTRGSYYPLFAQAVKYALSQQRKESYDHKIDEHATEFLKSYVLKEYCSDKILKPHEIINGMQNLKPMDMTTSAGPKLKKFFNIHTKRPVGNEDAIFINTSKTDTPWYVINKETAAGGMLLSDFSYYMSVIKQGQPICIVVKDNAKVELLPKEKVAQGKVRLFNEIDLSINMVLKAYFGAALDNVMAKHTTTMFCIGMNPYKDASAHMLYFNNIDGDFVNADFSALDKTITAKLIKEFVEAFLPHVQPEERDAMFKTLTYRLHSMNGNVYFTDSGNASGSFVTTLLNCYVVAKMSVYTFTRKYYEEYDTLPSYADIMDNMVLRILGDDAIRKVNNTIFNIPLTQEDFIDDALKYRLQQTPAKTSGDISFCSREYVKYKDVYFPRLKKSSITSCLFWFKRQEPEQIYQHCFTAIMEAGLWDKEFFDSVVSATMELAKVYKFKVDTASHSAVQECWYAYIRGWKDSPVWGRSNPGIINVNTNSTDNNQQFLKMADIWLNEYVQKHKLDAPVYDYSPVVKDNVVSWRCKASIKTKAEHVEGNGEAATKQAAKKLACAGIKEEVQAVSNMDAVDGNCIATVATARKWINEFVQKKGIQPPVCVYTSYGPDERKTWACRLELTIGARVYCVSATSKTKDEAKEYACEKIRKEVDPEYVEIEWLCCKHGKTEMHTSKCWEQKLIGTYSNDNKFKDYMKNEYPAITYISEENIQKLKKTECTTAIKTAIEGYLANNVLPTLQKKLTEYSDTVDKWDTRDLDCLLEEVHVTSNADVPIEPAVMNQAMNAQMASDLPSQNNPQPTAIAPAVTGPGDDIMSAVQIAQETTLNPMGAPNMLSVGGVGFDLKMLIYEQWMDCDIEYSTTESAPTGSIIFQIPYAIMSQYINGYIKAYARYHERYTGAIRVRLTGIGNQMLSGAVGVSWQPRRVTTSTILISEAQKFAYEMKGVNLPFNEIHSLHDARKGDFYREVKDDFGSLDERPHLVVFVGMNVYNAFRDNTLVRFRVATKLSNAREPNPFYFSLPMRIEDPKTATRSYASNVAPATSFDSTFPSILNVPVYIYTDGNLRRGSDYSYETRYEPYNPHSLSTAVMRKVSYRRTNQGLVTPTLGDPVSAEELASRWPTMDAYLKGSSTTFQKAMVCVVTQSTMDSARYATMLMACTLPGMNGIGGTLSEAEWNKAKTANAWVLDNEYIKNNDIKIYSILYNDQLVFLTTTNESFIMTSFRFSQIKVVTNHGTFFMYLTLSLGRSQAQNDLDFYYRCGLTNQVDLNGLPQTVKDMATYPLLNIDSSLGALPNFVALPAGYQALRISDIPASAVTIQGYPGPTASDDSVIERWFYKRSETLDDLQCLEFTMVDSTSQRLILTARYFREWRLFVISSDDAYSTLPIGTENITIQSIVEIDRSNAFQPTNTTSWFSRYSTTAQALKLIDSTGSSESYASSNAALALGAGLLSGLGQGMQKASDNKFDEKMQKNKFDQETKMQGNMFDHQTKMQQNQFDHNQSMALLNNDFQSMMQRNHFVETRYTNKMNSLNRMTETGLGTRTNFLNDTSSSFA